VLGANKHLFSEKPLGFGEGELEQIARAAKESKGRLMIGYHKRFDPVFERAKTAVAAIEDLRFVQVKVLHPDDNAYRAHHALLPVRTWVEPPEAQSNRATIDLLRAPPFDAILDEIAGKTAPTAQRVAAFLLYDSLLHDLNLVRGLIGEPEEVISAHYWNDGFAQTSVSRFPRDVRASISWISLPGLRHYEETLLFAGPRSRVKIVFPSPYLRHQATPISIERMDGEELLEEVRTVSHE
jgi:predicted dehydrogenase